MFRLAKEAWERIKSFNLKPKPVDFLDMLTGEDVDLFKRLISAVAEIGHEINNNPKAGQVISASNNGVSWTKKAVDSGIDELIKRQDNVIIRLLSGTKWHNLFISRVI